MGGFLVGLIVTSPCHCQVIHPRAGAYAGALLAELATLTEDHGPGKMRVFADSTPDSILQNSRSRLRSGATTRRPAI